MESGVMVTHKQAAKKIFVAYAKEILPFLRKRESVSSASSALHLDHKVCINGICILLGVSRNFLYSSRKISMRTCSFLPTYSANITDQQDHVSNPIQPSDTALSIVDSAGMREREFRRMGLRYGFPPLEEMNRFPCGCAEPCFWKVPFPQVEQNYADFLEISRNDGARHRENKVLLNIMFCPLSNSISRQCNRSIANLFTVSEGLVAGVRSTLKWMCENPELRNRRLRDDWRKSGYSSNYHPANRMSDSVRQRIENHLDMVLRPDPAGWNEVGVCRIYSPEFNKHEKLRKLLVTMLDSDEGGAKKIDFLHSSLRKMIEEYLAARSPLIAYQKTDHSACPTCKTVKYATFQYFKEYKHMQNEGKKLIQDIEGGNAACLQQKIGELRVKIEYKKQQEAEALSEYRLHCARDRSIRGAIKRMPDHFRKRENELISKQIFAQECPPWASIKNHATVTHQDDMTKVDPPYFVESASADITRWRLDVNAHVSSVNGDAAVFSHEQGTGGKNVGCVVEEILLDHLIRRRGPGLTPGPTTKFSG